MHDGKMTITVNSYLGKLKKTQIGRVYVEDLDDWDLGDKTFTWKDSLPGFELSPKGEITMDANMPPGTYQMSSNVHDNRRNENAVGYVTVNVLLVPEVAFVNQGSMQLLLADNSNLQYPEDFIRVDANGKSMMNTFTQEMVKYMGGNVVLDVFSIQLDYATLQTRTVPVLNIRFSAHGSPYRDSTQLNGLISANRYDLQNKMGATIVGVGIDMCKFTVCDSGCQTVSTADFNGVVVSANSTVLVGVNAQSKDECTCPVWRPPVQCQAGICHNDGACHNTHPGFFCECRNDLLKGSRCQGTTRSFSGDGFAWYKPMPACTSLNISMQFMTLQPDAVLFYNGPMDTKNSDLQIEYRDYIIIQLKAGRLSLEVCSFFFSVWLSFKIPKSESISVLVMLMLVYARRQTTPFESVRPEDLNRDNLRPYAIEGGGEADNDQYSIANLRKPVMPIEGNGLSLGPPAPVYTRPPIDDRLRSQLHDLESDQNAAPFDEIRIYEDEKDTVSVVTLESLGSLPETERQQNGNNWESRFTS
ncbi:hypothetical protein OESDEN_06739 [Oesophagostomum dentatum]|uniref:EGF-like domain-containing protein n=1 Tax=Oesophagostomum dentatum TaxID=61180 RepID=A0A0B1TBZ2_OESDE|nr:hypothetical protein OESDEN_06739 [Oesophagostomum dentatum]